MDSEIREKSPRYGKKVRNLSTIFPNLGKLIFGIAEFRLCIIFLGLR